MDQETYEALKKVVSRARSRYGMGDSINDLNDIVRLEGWMNEVAKEYQDN